MFNLYINPYLISIFIHFYPCLTPVSHTFYLCLAPVISLFYHYKNLSDPMKLNLLTPITTFKYYRHAILIRHFPLC